LDELLPRQLWQSIDVAAGDWYIQKLFDLQPDSKRLVRFFIRREGLHPYLRCRSSGEMAAGQV
jgi:hypothetical protein